MYSWEIEELKEKSTGEVALLVHQVRRELDAAASERASAARHMGEAERAYERAQEQFREKCDAERDISNRLKAMENHLNRRLENQE